MAGDVPSPSPNPGPADTARPGVPAAPLALYRRYRPATFAEVKGQDHVTEPLRQALRSGRVHHAYLFSGPRGCGKTSSARILARSLNCESGPTPDPCGTCASCVALAPAGPGSIDVIEIDAASHGGVDDARDLRERAFYAPVSARFKIYIIDEAHMVTGGGFNALLKLVEEPPPHLKFVFATTEPEKVIATIRSRTHHYPFRLVPPAILRELLEQILGSEGVRYEPAVLPVVIRAGAGSVRDSLSVLDQLIAGSDESGLSYERAVGLLGYTDDALLDEVAEAFAAGDGAAVFRAVDKVVEGGHDPRRFAADLLDRFRDLIVLAAVPDAAASGLLDVPADRLERMREQAAEFGAAQLVSAAETISSGLVEMRGATSPRLLLELMCAQVLLPAPGTGEKDLLERLERLERREGSPPQAGMAAVASTGSRGRESSGPSGPAARPESTQTVPRADAQSAAADAQSAAAGAGQGAAAGAGQGAAAASQEVAAGAGQGAAAKADTGTIRERWDAVLEAVWRERRVAWLLLSNATVDSVTDGVLTLMFSKEGEARGFAISGYDRDLGQVLQSMFGVTLQIRAIVGSAQGAAPRGLRPQSPGPQEPDLRDPPSHDYGPQDRGPQEHGPQEHAPQEHAPQGRGQQGRGSQGRRSQDRAPQEHAPAGSARRAEASGTNGKLAARAASRTGTGTPRQPPEADMGDMSDADALTGMDLIERELGGQIIEEIDGA
jgi:DNA polymerase III subunit gamma/tau